ncbi:MAG: PQQ-dependent sugar dehydrogenase [Pseudomonadales bacterium]
MKILKYLLLGLLTLVLLLVFILAGLINFGPIKISSFPMLANAITGKGIDTPSEDVLQLRLQVPDGFQLTLFAENLPMVRFMRSTPSGALIISRPRAGEVVLLADNNRDGRADEKRVLLSGLKRPHGLELHQGWLYIAESHQVGRVAYDGESDSLTGDYEVIIPDLTDEGNHWSKTVGVGPDGMLYLAQGSTCNVCEEEDTRRATIMRFNSDGSGGEIYASGLRNSVGIDWAPWSGQLYATDNGRDLIGDDFPPCELNQIVKGGFYGWPYVNGSNVADPDYGPGPTALVSRAIPPAHDFNAHNAPLGMSFINASSLPAAFEQSALVALHGSWNRSEPDGYKVVSLHWLDGQIEERDFVWGFEEEGNIIGRPADITQDAEGAIYISDDYAGAIYRVTYGEQSGTAVSQLVSVQEPGLSEQIESGFIPVASVLSEDEVSTLAGEGAALYEEHVCAGCHIEDLPEENRMSLRNLVERYNSDDIVQLLVTPTPPMPVFPLSDADRKALSYYLLAR